VINRILRGRGGNYQMMGRFEEAIANYRVALAATPLDAELRDYLAMCYNMTKEYGAEQAVLEEGARLTPNAIRFARLGRSYFRAGRWQNAREALSLALKNGQDGTLPEWERKDTQLMYEQTVKITDAR
jgi:tetratricopeptide (TPR) repeat protein